jgi:hypothetical protein
MRTLIATALVLMMPMVAVGQVSPEEALRKLKEQEAAANDPVKLREENAALRAEVAKLTQELAAIKSQLAELQAKMGEPVTPEAQQEPATRGTVDFPSLTALVQTIPEDVLPDKRDRDEKIKYSAVHGKNIADAMAKAVGKTITLKMVVPNAVTDAQWQETDANGKRSLVGGYLVSGTQREGTRYKRGTYELLLIKHAGVSWTHRVFVRFSTSEADKLAKLRVDDVITVTGTIVSWRYQGHPNSVDIMPGFSGIPAHHTPELTLMGTQWEQAR